MMTGCRVLNSKHRNYTKSAYRGTIKTDQWHGSQRKTETSKYNQKLKAPITSSSNWQYIRHVPMMEPEHSEIIVHNLAHTLLSEQEFESFWYALQQFQKSHSVTTFCSQLRPLITTKDRLLLLVEVSKLIPRHLADDYHRVCNLQFPSYNVAFQACNPGTVRREASRIIAQDASGKYCVVSQGNFKTLFINNSTISEHGSSFRIAGGSEARHANDDINDELVNDVFLDKNSSTKTPNAKYSESRNGDYIDKVMSSPSYSHHQPAVVAVKSGNLKNIAEKPNTLATKNIRKVVLLRHGNRSLGFSLVGGDRMPIIIHQLESGGLAEQQGLKPGDQILEANGRNLSNINLAVTVEFLRRSSKLDLLVKTAPDFQNEREDAGVEKDIMIYPSVHGRLGCIITRDGKDVVVKSVSMNSPANDAGLREGDKILKIDGVDVGLLTEKQIIALATVSKKVKLCIKKSVTGANMQYYQKTRLSGDDSFSPNDLSSPVIKVENLDVFNGDVASESSTLGYSFIHQNPGTYSTTYQPPEETAYRFHSSTQHQNSSKWDKMRKQFPSDAIGITHPHLLSANVSAQRTLLSMQSAPGGLKFSRPSSLSPLYLPDYGKRDYNKSDDQLFNISGTLLHNRSSFGPDFRYGLSRSSENLLEGTNRNKTHSKNMANYKSKMAFYNDDSMYRGLTNGLEKRHKAAHLSKYLRDND